METNIINKTDFGSLSFARLDAEYVRKTVWEIEQRLRQLKGKQLAELTLGYDGPVLNEGFCDEDALIRYLDIDSIDTMDGLAYTDELLYGDRPSRAKYKVQLNDLLVSNVRPNRGAVTFIGEAQQDALASSGFTLLRNTNVELQRYIYAFLKSRFGRIQMVRRTRGSMYPAITRDDLLDIWIPSPPDGLLSKVNGYVQSGVAHQNRFFELLTQQSDVLESYLSPFGHPPSPLEGDITHANWTEIHEGEIRNAQRIDAEFFRKEYRIFDAKLQGAAPTFLLGDYYQLAAGRGLGNGEAIVPFIKQGILTNAGINWSALSYEIGASKAKGGNVRPGDILLACTAHEVYYVGRKVDFVREVPKEIAHNNAAVPDLIVMRPRLEKPTKMYGSYVAAFLRSPSGLHQVQRCIRGLRGGHVYKDDLSRYVRLPVPPDPWLDAFEERARAYESVRSEAKDKMSNSFRCIEDWLASKGLPGAETEAEYEVVS